MKTKNCTFCAEISGDINESLFHEITTSDFKDTIIWSDEDFVIVPTIGCFIEGYVLLLPRNHIASYSALCEEKMIKLSVIVQEIKNILARIYNKPIVTFEHGSVLGCRLGGGGCVDHAHMHFIPSDVSYSNYAEKHYQIVKIDSFVPLIHFERRRMPYLYFSNPNGDQYICDAENAVSQYFRQITAMHEKLENVWRWQTYPFLDKMEATYNKLRAYFYNFNISI